MAEYVLTNKAVEDLSEIWDYTYDVWSENQANKYYKRLIDTCAEIAGKPSIGREFDVIFKNLLGFPVGKHIIFYRVLRAENIEILRILHERMDLKNRLTDR